MTRLARGLALALALTALACTAHASQCAQHYVGEREALIVNPRLAERAHEICYSGYVVVHSGRSLGPLWSAEHLTRERVAAARRLVRVNSFHPEPSLAPGERAELADYSRSGFDRGHMAPNGDMFDPLSQQESFSLANVVPQRRANNVGIWADIETAVRDLAVDEGEIYVISGPAFIGSEVRAIGRGVLVPTHLWKLVYSVRRRAAAAYWIANDDTDAYEALSVAELEARVGVQLLPALGRASSVRMLALPAPRQRAARLLPPVETRQPPGLEEEIGRAARRALSRLLHAR